MHNWEFVPKKNSYTNGIEKIKTNASNSCQYVLPLTLVFLKKRLKYALDWHDSKPSCLVYLSKNTGTTIQLLSKYAQFKGELIRYGEETLSDSDI